MQKLFKVGCKLEDIVFKLVCTFIIVLPLINMYICSNKYIGIRELAENYPVYTLFCMSLIIFFFIILMLSFSYKNRSNLKFYEKYKSNKNTDEVKIEVRINRLFYIIDKFVVTIIVPYALLYWGWFYIVIIWNLLFKGLHLLEYQNILKAWFYIPVYILFILTIKLILNINISLDNKKKERNKINDYFNGYKS